MQVARVEVITPGISSEAPSSQPQIEIGYKKGIRMDKDSLTKEQSQIEGYVYRFYDKSDENTEPILDGIVNEEKYLNEY